MKNEVGPAASTSRAKLSLIPRTTDDRATTTKTPTATPMIVRNARTLFARIDSIASVTPSMARSSRFTMRIARSLLPQCFDRIETCRATSGIHARHDTDDESEHRGRHERPGRYRRWEEREFPRDPFGDGDAERDTDDRSERAQRRRLGEELAQNVTAPCA